MYALKDVSHKSAETEYAAFLDSKGLSLFRKKFLVSEITKRETTVAYSPLTGFTGSASSAGGLNFDEFGYTTVTEEK